MKKITPFILLIWAFYLSGCKYTCDNNQQPPCTDKVPVNEACTAYFERWFYNHSTNQCELKAYSGCTAWGFATKEACESCRCN